MSAPWMKPSSGVFDIRGDAVPEATSDERRPEDDAECDRLGCEDRTHPVHHRVSLAALWRQQADSIELDIAEGEYGARATVRTLRRCADELDGLVS